MSKANLPTVRPPVGLEDRNRIKAIFQLLPNYFIMLWLEFHVKLYALAQKPTYRKARHEIRIQDCIYLSIKFLSLLVKNQ